MPGVNHDRRINGRDGPHSAIHRQELQRENRSGPLRTKCQRDEQWCRERNADRCRKREERQPFHQCQVVSAQCRAIRGDTGKDGRCDLRNQRADPFHWQRGNFPSQRVRAQHTLAQDSPDNGKVRILIRPTTTCQPTRSDSEISRTCVGNASRWRRTRQARTDATALAARLPNTSERYRNPRKASVIVKAICTALDAASIKESWRKRRSRASSARGSTPIDENRKWRLRITTTPRISDSP